MICACKRDLNFVNQSVLIIILLIHYNEQAQRLFLIILIIQRLIFNLTFCLSNALKHCLITPFYVWHNSQFQYISFVRLSFFNNQFCIKFYLCLTFSKFNTIQKYPSFVSSKEGQCDLLLVDFRVGQQKQEKGSNQKLKYFVHNYKTQTLIICVLVILTFVQLQNPYQIKLSAQYILAIFYKLPYALNLIYKNMSIDNVNVQLSISFQQSQNQQAKQLFDQIELSSEEQKQNDLQNQQQSINMRDYKIKKTKKEKKKIKKIKKIKQKKQKAQLSKMKIQSDEDQKSKNQQNNQNQSEKSQQYSIHQESNSESDQIIKNLNPNSQDQIQIEKPKRLMQASKKWMKQKLIDKSSAKKKRIQISERFRLDQLGNDGIIDQLNQSIDEDDDSFSENGKKSKKKGKKQKNHKEVKQKLTNQQLLKKLGEIGCGQSEQQLDSQRYNVDSGIQNVHRMKGKRQQKKGIKVQNKLFNNIQLNIDKQNGQMPPQQNLQLQLKPKVSQHSICSSFLAKIQTIKKTRGLEANVNQIEFQKMNKQKNKKSINKLVSKLNDQIEKDQDIDLMVRVPSFSRGKSADIINNTLYIKTYSQNNKVQEKNQETQVKKENKPVLKNGKNKPISRNQFFKNIKTDVQLRRSKYISDELLVNNIKKSNLQELEEIRIKRQQKRRKEAMIQLGQYDDAEDYIQDLQDQLNEKGVSKKQLRRLIQLQQGIQDDNEADQADQNQIQIQSKGQKIQEEGQIQKKQDAKSNIEKALSEKNSQMKSKKSQQMDIQPDMIEQFEDENQNELKQFQQQKIINENSQEENQSDNSEVENQNQEDEEQEQELQQKQQNQEKINEQKIKLAEEQSKRKKQLEEMQQEGIGMKKRYLLAEKTESIQFNLRVSVVKQDEKENTDSNIINQNNGKNQTAKEESLSKLKKYPTTSNNQIDQQQNQGEQSEQLKEKQIQQNQQHFKEFKKLRKIATIIAQKRQKREQELKRAKQFFQQEAQLGSDNQDHDEIVKKINRKEEDDEYDGADLDQQLEELIDNAVDINQENEQAAFKKYMEQEKQKDREELQKILRGQFKRKQIDFQLEEDQKNRNQRRQKMMEWIQKQQQDEADLYAKQSSAESEQEDSYYGYKTHRKNKKSKKQEEEQMQEQIAGEQEESKQDINKKLQMYLEDSISPNKNKRQKFEAHLELLRSIPQSKIGQKQVISLNSLKKTISNSITQPITNSQPPKYSSNSLLGGLFNLTGPSKNHEKSNTTGVKLKKTHSHMNQYLKKTVSQSKKTLNEGTKLPSMFNKAISVKK